MKSADLTAYNLSAMRPMRFEFARKEARVNMRLPNNFLAAIKVTAIGAGMPYQRFIRRFWSLVARTSQSIDLWIARYSVRGNKCLGGCLVEK